MIIPSKFGQRNYGSTDCRGESDSRAVEGGRRITDDLSENVSYRVPFTSTSFSSFTSQLAGAALSNRFLRNNIFPTRTAANEEWRINRNNLVNQLLHELRLERGNTSMCMKMKVKI